MATETFSITPEYAYVITPTASTIQTPFEGGQVQTRARWSKLKRKWMLQWRAATTSEVAELRGFFRDMNGSAGDFYYVPDEKVAPPYTAATLSQTDGGTEDLGSRTRYVGYTWSDSSDNETTVSNQTASLAVGSGKVLTATVPNFPQNVAKAWVYVGATASDLHKQATAITTSGGMWTEPQSGYDSGGATIPSSNAFNETVTVHFAEDSMQIVKMSPAHYSVQVTLEELL